MARLLATERQSGVDAGLFGTQDPTFDGAFRQGLSLAALAAAGITTGSQVSAAVAWLTHQQCPDGGWTSYITLTNQCALLSAATFAAFLVLFPVARYRLGAAIAWPLVA